MVLILVRPFLRIYPPRQSCRSWPALSNDTTWSKTGILIKKLFYFFDKIGHETPRDEPKKIMKKIPIWGIFISIICRHKMKIANWLDLEIPKQSNLIIRYPSITTAVTFGKLICQNIWYQKSVKVWRRYNISYMNSLQ